jgi:hypothetical protein
VRGKQGRRHGWILRGAIATVGLAGAVYAADQVTAPPTDDLESTIAAQRVAEGRSAKPGAPSEHQAESFTPAQMVELAARYGAEMKQSGEHAETLRIVAYRSRDLIRMTCIDDKLTQIMIIINKAEPRVQSLSTVNPDELVMRQHFTVLQQARARVAELAIEMEQCMGDNLAAVPAGRIKEEVQTDDNDNVFDPTRPPTPTRDIERPPEASPYR